MSDSPTPGLTDVLAVRQRIAPCLPRTPLFTYPQLDELVGAEVHVEHENHPPVGAFKVRSGSTSSPSSRTTSASAR
jgi:threonine dehydratase